jgi:hypothetical protein
MAQNEVYVIEWDATKEGFEGHRLRELLLSTLEKNGLHVENTIYRQKGYLFMVSFGPNTLEEVLYSFNSI